MRLRITMVDHAPEQLYAAVPFELVVLRKLPGPDRDDYWLAQLAEPLEIEVRGGPVTVSHFIVASRWEGTRIEPSAEHLPINLAAVVDVSQLSADSVEFEKSEFIAIGMADEVGGGNRPPPLTSILGGAIRGFFSKRNNTGDAR